MALSTDLPHSFVLDSSNISSGGRSFFFLVKQAFLSRVGQLQSRMTASLDSTVLDFSDNNSCLDKNRTCGHQ